MLEVGAGIGTLTLGLADRAGWVTAVEVDRGLQRALRATAGHRPNVRIIPGDIMELPPATLFDGPAGAPRKVVANLPYNIASAVLTRLLEHRLGLAVLIVTVQREVAERIAARPGSPAYGLLSIAIRFRAVPRLVARIGPRAFLPPPEVESALVELTPLREPPVTVPDDREFFRIVAAGFGQRRKTIHNALVGGLGLGRQVVERALGAAGIDPRVRAETLDVAAFGRLARVLHEHLPNLLPPEGAGRPRRRDRRSRAAIEGTGGPG